MQVKDQIRLRMEELGISVSELRKRLGVSDQTVRFWLNGRNYPKKTMAQALERELSFKLDFTEGSAPPDAAPMAHTMERSDVETFLAINRLPTPIKVQFGRLAEEIERYLRTEGATLREPAVRPRR